MITGRDIANKARELVDVRFHHQGRSREGLDCGGLIALDCTELGLAVVDATGYPRTPDLPFMRRFLGWNAREVPDRPPLEGMVLLFIILRIQPHLGILVAPEWFVHTYESMAKVMLTRFDPKWQARVDSVWELNGVVR